YQPTTAFVEIHVTNDIVGRRELKSLHHFQRIRIDFLHFSWICDIERILSGGVLDCDGTGSHALPRSPTDIKPPQAPAPGCFRLTEPHFAAPGERQPQTQLNKRSRNCGLSVKAGSVYLKQS